MRLNISNIKWDTDGQAINLPSCVALDVDKDFDIELETANTLSDMFGYCIFSLDVQSDV